MYVAGIIPGLKEPSLTELNHSLCPLIDDLVIAYEQGMKLSHTYMYQSGCLCCCTAGLSVNDLPAARKISQFASHNSLFYCTTCDFYHLTTCGDID